MAESHNTSCFGMSNEQPSGADGLATYSQSQFQPQCVGQVAGHCGHPIMPATSGSASTVRVLIGCAINTCVPHEAMIIAHILVEG